VIAKTETNIVECSVGYVGAIRHQRSLVVSLHSFLIE
jgi:hypothetical protein